MTFALPSEPAPWVALAAAVVIAFVPRVRQLLMKSDLGAFVTVSAGLAALLSGLYVAFYLRGGPRIIDATSYFMEGRALSKGHMAFSLEDPEAATMGRFMVRDSLDRGEHAAVIFPPGYPALLAIGFWLRAPMLIGPLLAALLTGATAMLAKASLPRSLAAGERDVAVRIAVMLSVVCATLRYHTADTMSHGLAACLVTASLALAARLRERQPRGRDYVWIGAALGALVCTRPVSGLVTAAVVLFALRARARPAAGLAAAGALPFAGLLAAHQRAATGAFWVSSQSRYYASSDTPPGCFSYGFGERIGCRFEHGDFVDQYMKTGFGFTEVLGTTARRLAMHSADALNAGPLVLLVVFAIGLAWTSAGRDAPMLRACAATVGLFVLGYAPFYFDGNYPGGGARFFADVLPLEHVLIGWAIVRVRIDGFDIERRAASVAALALAGFAFFTHADHEALREREGGRPMFEPKVLESANVHGGLVFVDTDHGFDLGYDPDRRASATTIEVARYRGDANDWLIWNARGRPPAFVYRYGVGDGKVGVIPYEPKDTGIIEGESLWPAIDQNNASALPVHTPEPCASGGKWLVISTFAPNSTIRVRIPRAPPATRIVPIAGGRGAFDVVLSLVVDGRIVESAALRSSGTNGVACFEGPPLDVPPLEGDKGPGRLELLVTSREVAPEGLFALDALKIAQSR